MTKEFGSLHEARESSRSKDERMIDIFELINSAPPANNTEEAFKLIHDSFSHVEENATDPMNVGDFHKMLEMKIEGKNIHYCWYIGHVLLIGENGSIEI